MTPETTYFETRLATDQADLLSAQRLRYRVFVEELGGNGALVDHEQRLERDEFDPVVDHLVLVDKRRSCADLDHVVGVYRVLPGDRATEFGRFYCDGEYDLAPLRASGRSLLEMGRSCVDAEFRGGAALLLIWNALAEYVLSRDFDILFGVASFHGTDTAQLAQALSWLHHNHLAPQALRPRALPQGFQDMNLIAAVDLDRRAAMTAMPPLIKAYLRLGGTVGEGAFLDREFNTTDVFLSLDTKNMSQKHRNFYQPRKDG